MDDIEVLYIAVCALVLCVLSLLCACSSRIRRGAASLCDRRNAARAREPQEFDGVHGSTCRSEFHPELSHETSHPSILAELPQFEPGVTSPDGTESFFSFASDDSVESFVSCIGEDLHRAVSGPISVARPSCKGVDVVQVAAAAAAAVDHEARARPKQQRVRHLRTRNSNRVSSYRWLASVLKGIVEETGAGGVRDSDSREPGTPLFVVAGGCPNGICGMQAMMYVWMKRGAVDFWWIKPSRSSAEQLERETMNKNSKGPHKNTAERSARLYQPLADKFMGQAEGDFRFKVDACGRACIVEVGTEDSPTRTEFILYLVWQEDWSGAMARVKYIEGKLCYKKVRIELEEVDDAEVLSAPRSQKETMIPGFFARQYRIQNDRIWIAPSEDEEVVRSLLPPDTLQEMYEMDF